MYMKQVPFSFKTSDRNNGPEMSTERIEAR